MDEFDLVRIREIEECRHEDSRVWKSKKYLEIQKLMDIIRKKEVSLFFVYSERNCLPAKNYYNEFKLKFQGENQNGIE